MWQAPPATRATSNGEKRAGGNPFEAPRSGDYPTPPLMRKENFTTYTNSEVLEVLADASDKRATGVTYIDSSGDEWEQPADLVIVAAFTFENVRLMLLSGIGEAYDPVTNKGTTGHNYAYQTTNNVTLLFR
ncbi:GMC family oxidoreductase N-terminal domain-containing protein [Candidatus Pantoea persica]|uniref:GMC family oxidoreductase N-terminal domain-containing protein n=1 Tax=Candidatus Pantoea persica TaxID=2518128 RepID=UPI00403E1EFA|nr:GMC family oxidoreductase [Candidatus Pantoea persica]